MDFVVLSSKPLSERERFLQEGMNTMAEMEVEKIAVVAMLPGGEVMTAYFQMGLNDKVLAAGHLQMDAMTDCMRVNRDYIFGEEEDE